jgi:acyl-CoA thioesterase FadM
LTLVGQATVGEIVDVRTSFSHLGNSSLRFAHGMIGPGGREIAFLVQSGVHLDMEARRSAPIPDQLRASIQELLIRDP